jgi:hypothetical protein
MPEIQLTEAERNLILLIRRQGIEHGEIPCIIYIQDGKLMRVKLEKVIESVKL